MAERELPQNIEAEQSVLGAIMLSRDAILAATEYTPHVQKLPPPCPILVYHFITTSAEPGKYPGGVKITPHFKWGVILSLGDV